MSGNSKREKVDSFMRRAVMETVHEIVFKNGPDAKIREYIEALRTGTAWRITGDAYRMKELQDIMDWKQGPRKYEKTPPRLAG